MPTLAHEPGRTKPNRSNAHAAAYGTVGSRGNVTRSALFALAAERWGRAVKSSGHFTYGRARRVTFA